MNGNTIFGFTMGVCAGVAGTLIVDYILKKREDAEFEDDVEDADSEEETVNPPRDEYSEVTIRTRSGIEEKPELANVIDYRKYARELDDTVQAESDALSYYALSQKYNKNEDPDIQKIIDKTVERVYGEPVAVGVDMAEGPDHYVEVLANDEAREAAQSVSIFDKCDVVTEKHEKADAVPPTHRKVQQVMDIMQISAGQFCQEALDYRKKTCTFFPEEGILAGCDDDLDIMDVASTVGESTIEFFEQDDDIDVLYVSNITTETDYEIVRSRDSYQASYDEARDPRENIGDSEWKEETQ